eukprot:GHRR01013670.1.p1 GENE.GHRR01013670.1~~GHRR01013670.1.p1  ORF type:complete len:433 (+),score=155.26 GHRR01013670.1:292-1590(+)
MMQCRSQLPRSVALLQRCSHAQPLWRSHAYRGNPRPQHHQARLNDSNVTVSNGFTPQPCLLPGPPSFTLEAPVGTSSPLDAQLVATGAFGAEVHPDLPIATTWHGLYKQIALRFSGETRTKAIAAAAKAQAAMTDVKAASMAAVSAVVEQTMTARVVQPALRVVTVGAQLKSMGSITEALCTAAGFTTAGYPATTASPGASVSALLLVSGSHPFRQLPMVQQLLPGSVAMLKHASQLKQQGILPANLALWAVANPVTEKDASYTEQKIAAGAEVILTQPPLDWPTFQSWMADAHRRSLPTATRLLVGFPCLSSAANTAFWLALCRGAGNIQCQQLLQQVQAAEAAEKQQQNKAGKGSKQGVVQFLQQWNGQLLANLQSTPGVAGLHVMPITAAGKRMALQLIDDGGFASTAWRHASSAGTSSSRNSSSQVTI